MSLADVTLAEWIAIGIGTTICAFFAFFAWRIVSYR